MVEYIRFESFFYSALINSNSSTMGGVWVGWSKSQILCHWCETKARSYTYCALGMFEPPFSILWSKYCRTKRDQEFNSILLVLYAWQFQFYIFPFWTSSKYWSIPSRISSSWREGLLNRCCVVSGCLLSAANVEDTFTIRQFSDKKGSNYLVSIMTALVLVLRVSLAYSRSGGWSKKSLVPVPLPTPALLMSISNLTLSLARSETNFLMFS